MDVRKTQILHNDAGEGNNFFLNGHCQPCDGVLIDSVSMGVWWIAWLATLAVVCLTDGKLNSRQMPPRVPLPPSYPQHKLTNISVFYAAALAPLLSLPAFFCPIYPVISLRSTCIHLIWVYCLKVWLSMVFQSHSLNFYKLIQHEYECQLNL